MFPNILKSKAKPLFVQATKTDTFTYRMNFDGCSKGNPGLSGAGAVIYNEGNEIWSGSQFVGTKSTNNCAEYSGLILGLQQAIQLNIKNLLVQGDSQLVIYQMQGKYQCKSDALVELYTTAKHLAEQFDVICFEHEIGRAHV